MNIEIVQQGVRHYDVRIERLGLIGHIYDFHAGPFKFKYASDRWMQLTYDENTAVLAAVKPKVTLLNITRRLTK